MGWEDAPAAGSGSCSAPAAAPDSVCPSDADPCIDHLLSNYKSLNEEGRQKLTEDSDILVASGLYSKNILSDVS